MTLVQNIVRLAALEHNLIPVLTSCTPEQSHESVEEVLKVRRLVQFCLNAWNLAQVDHGKQLNANDRKHVNRE